MLEYHIYLVLALICMSVMETIEHHFSSSIFFLLPIGRLFYFFQSKNPRTKLFDAYHVSKWLMLIFFWLAIRSFDITVTWWVHGLSTALFIWAIHKLFYENLWLRGDYKYWRIGRINE
jgi:hypothetical protein